jgi:hypothetical protein
MYLDIDPALLRNNKYYTNATWRIWACASMRMPPIAYLSSFDILVFKLVWSYGHQIHKITMTSTIRMLLAIKQIQFSSWQDVHQSN